MSISFHRGLENYPQAQPRSAIATVGTFDGIHRAHQEILRRVSARAGESALTPVMVTFHPHPRVVVSPDRVPLLLTTIEEKEQFLPDFFDGRVLIMEFDEQLRDMTAERFVEEILVDRLGIAGLIVGYDHSLGKDRGGTTDVLKRLSRKHGFELEITDAVIHEGEAVSASTIRKSMTRGHYDEAISMLGHCYAIYGTVERGIGLGSKLGYPTANVSYDQRKLLPPQGVYACRVHLDEEVHDGMMFIGQNHFNPQARISVEANLFDFDRNLYGRAITVYPTRFIRENRTFADTTALARQIEEDKKIIQSMIKQGEKTCQ